MLHSDVGVARVYSSRRRQHQDEAMASKIVIAEILAVSASGGLTFADPFRIASR
jgi:hypothetical protein